jgi:hypothetical protein
MYYTSGITLQLRWEPNLSYNPDWIRLYPDRSGPAWIILYRAMLSHDSFKIRFISWDDVENSADVTNWYYLPDSFDSESVIDAKRMKVSEVEFSENNDDWEYPDWYTPTKPIPFFFLQTTDAYESIDELEAVSTTVRPTTVTTTTSMLRSNTTTSTTTTTTIETATEEPWWKKLWNGVMGIVNFFTGK